MARLLYFSWVREKIGTPAEEIPLPADVVTVTRLLDFLRACTPRHAEALAHPTLRVAVNQTHARADDPVSDQDEIAIFPPVSGG
ncbi:MAG: molybdopterin converting factor subunit 1 [Magnetococcales bacterium]|nr:molybdopterin converting factor subunit 1 [Magnetococcales bacterium]